MANCVTIIFVTHTVQSTGRVECPQCRRQSHGLWNMEEFPDSDEESDAAPGTDELADSDAEDAATQARLALRTVSEQFDDSQLRSALAASAATATAAAATAAAAAVIYGNYTVPAGHTAGQTYQLTLRGTTVSVTGDEWAPVHTFVPAPTVFPLEVRGIICV